LPKHNLYFRINSEDYVDGNLVEARIKIPDLSTNWSKYSKPHDVILSNPKDGVAWVKVRDLPQQLPEKIESKHEKPCRFYPGHDPLDENYPHTEIRMNKGDDRADSSTSIGSKVKKAYRSMIRSSAVISLPPRD